MKVYLTKTMIGLIPAEENSHKWFDKIKLGEVVKAEFKKVRNYRFLKKYFALLNLAYDAWEPGETIQSMVFQRKILIVSAPMLPSLQDTLRQQFALTAALELSLKAYHLRV